MFTLATFVTNPISFLVVIALVLLVLSIVPSIEQAKNEKLSILKDMKSKGLKPFYSVEFHNEKAKQYSNVCFAVCGLIGFAYTAVATFTFTI